MKTKLTLLLSVLALAGFTIAAKAGPSDSVAFALRHAQENAGKMNAPARTASSESGPVRYVPASNGKGGVVLVRSNEPTSTNIALFKSKGASGGSAACCAKH